MSLETLKKAYSWLDHDKDSKVSLDDIKQSCSITDDLEAKTIFQSLCPIGENHIKFEDFCKGVMNFPNLLNSLNQNCIVEHDPSLQNLSSIIEKLFKILDIPFQIQENLDNSAEMIGRELKNIKKRSKDEIIEICQKIFDWTMILKDYNDSLLQGIAHKNTENLFHQEILSKDKERAERNYDLLATEHKKLENSFKELQKIHLELEHEYREVYKNLESMEEKYDYLCKNFEDIKEKNTEKDKFILDLQKKLRITSGLSLIKTDKKTGLTPKGYNYSLTTAVSQIQSNTITPKARGWFNFDRNSADDSVKDQIIKNLKNELMESVNKLYILEQEIVKLEYKNNELIEKIKLMSFKTLSKSDEEEDYKYETLGSLRDEIAVIDLDFLSSRASIKNLKTREIGIQAEVPIHPKKSRYSCFSLFR
ncbi:hypothetical protein SteCoe_17048 [Stentor coeruleus]|uniref:EF-hand domain-containing protein n=1 Tax=Stentor coeruleus TaxID=5963 RepID=A0A1R2BZT5_9CILI|nr:hypothetical protein SteCoe_17048 [Stentor coeruleus]